MATSKKFQDEQENFFFELWHKYVAYWPLFVLLLAVFIGISFAYLRYAVPIFETSATILVKDEKKGIDESSMMEQLNLFTSKKLVENEIEVIQSRSLMRNVVQNFFLYAPVTQEGRVSSRSAYLTSPILVEIKDPAKMKERKKIYFNYDSASNMVLIDSHKYPLNTFISFPFGEARFTLNYQYEQPDVKKPLYFSLINEKKVVDELIKNLKVLQATKLASVIDLKYKDEVPKRAEDILNDLISEYNKASLADKNALASSTLKFVNDRLQLVSHELDSVELGIQKYKSSSGIVDISAQGQQYLTNTGLNDQKVSEVSVQLSALDQIEKYVMSKDEDAAIVPSTFGIDNEILTTLLAKLGDLEVQYEGLKKTTAVNNPLAISLHNEIDRIKPGILENIRSLRQNLEAARKNLDNTSSRYNGMLTSLPVKEKRLIEISRQQLIKNNIYTFLLQKREETALNYNSTIADTRIVDKAETAVLPVSPKPILVFLFAVVGSLIVGAGVIAIKEVFNSTIIFQSEIQKYTDIPVVGEIMHEVSASPLVIQEGQRTIIAEQFRQLRTSLTYLGINNRKKKILITSTIPGEGKSFISANLGISLALMDKKVVLLELDLRKPKVSKLFGLSREVGITNYLIGNKEADEIIKATDVSANLFVIPSGAIPPNPSELILNGRFEELLAYLDTMFDYIIIDTAPTSPVTDAYIISPFCDVTLYVIRHGVTPKYLVKLMDENLKVKGLKNLAIVFNDVKKRGLTKYNYGYGYGMSGQYSYGEDDKKSGLINRMFKKSIPS